MGIVIRAGKTNVALHSKNLRVKVDHMNFRVEYVRLFRKSNANWIVSFDHRSINISVASLLHTQI